jgi:nucleoside-diphosphate-sugar epimerase
MLKGRQSKIVVTGANGYIGSRFCQTFNASLITGCVRSFTGLIDGCNAIMETGDLTQFVEWDDLLRDVECVVHLAARAHVENDPSKNPIDEFRRINTDVTLKIAEGAANSGVKRFVYVSSIGVLGNSTLNVDPFDNYSPYNPKEPYAISKMEAEIGLKKISDTTGMEVVIVRPPLVYGPNSPGNFHRLLHLVNTRFFLPFGNINTRKSMISLEDLCNFLEKCVVMPLPCFSKFVISDNSLWTVKNLVQLLAKNMQKKQLLLPIPIFFLKGIAVLIGKSKDIQKLTTPLIVDNSESAKIMKWSPIHTPEKNLKDAVDFYLKNK